MRTIERVIHLCWTGITLWVDGCRFLHLVLGSRRALAAENLFLRKQLAFYRERQVRPRRASVATRVELVLLARLFAWKEALIIVNLETLVRWHRQGFRLYWRWRSKPGGPPQVPMDVRRLIWRMAGENPS